MKNDLVYFLLNILVSYSFGYYLAWRQGKKKEAVLQGLFETMTSKAEESLKWAEYWQKQWRGLKRRKDG